LVADNHNNFNLTVFSQDGKLINALESKVKHAQCFDVGLMDDGSIVLASKDYRIYVYKYVNSAIYPNSLAAIEFVPNEANYFSPTASVSSSASSSSSSSSSSASSSASCSSNNNHPSSNNNNPFSSQYDTGFDLFGGKQTKSSLFSTNSSLFNLLNSNRYSNPPEFLLNDDDSDSLTPLYPSVMTNGNNPSKQNCESIFDSASIKHLSNELLLNESDTLTPLFPSKFEFTELNNNNPSNPNANQLSDYDSASSNHLNGVTTTPSSTLASILNGFL
jgi:hypothetical protein